MHPGKDALHTDFGIPYISVNELHPTNIKTTIAEKNILKFDVYETLQIGSISLHYHNHKFAMEENF